MAVVLDTNLEPLNHFMYPHLSANDSSISQAQPSRLPPTVLVDQMRPFTAGQQRMLAGTEQPLLPLSSHLLDPSQVVVSLPMEASPQILPQDTMRRTGRMSHRPQLSDATKAIAYTKTGRISKAKKGVKGAHNCACGKSYSRAEHLRRHQQNHGEILYCKHADCGKTFHRRDLLRRHEEKHLQGDSMHMTMSRSPSMGYTTASELDPSSIGGSGLSHQATPNFSPAPTHTTLVSQPATPFHQSDASAMSAPSGTDAFGKSTLGLGINTTTAPSVPAEGSMTALQDLTAVPFSTSSDFAGSWVAFAPQPTTNSLYTHRPTPPITSADAWGSPYIHAMESPMPSTTAALPYWYPPEKAFASDVNTSLDMSLPIDLQTALPTVSDSVSPYVPYATSQWDQASVASITPIGAHDPSTSPVSVFDSQPLSASASVHAKQSYTDAFWEYFHPLFPILHKPTVQQKRQTPRAPTAIDILLAAVIAMCGSILTRDPTRWRDGRILMRKCLQHIRDEQINPTADLISMQACFLLEAFSIFHSQRAQTQMSGRFQAIVAQLQVDPDVQLIMPQPRFSSPSREEQYAHQWLSWVRVQSKQRLLLACNVLMTQSALYLSQHSNLARLSWRGLLVPASTRLWDANSLSEWRSRYIDEVQTLSVTDALDSFQNTRLTPLDYFQSSVMVAAQSTSRPTNPISARALGLAISQAPMAQFHFHGACLATSAPLKALMAVAGESWTPFGGRLATHARTAALELSHTKSLLRSWVNAGFSPAQPTFSMLANALSQHDNGGVDASLSDNGTHRAVHHALSIIRLAHHLEAEGLTLPFAGEMPLYAATLVLWAVGFGYMARTAGGVPNANVSPPLQGAQDDLMAQHNAIAFVADTTPALLKSLWSTAHPSISMAWRNGVDAVMHWSRLMIGGRISPDAVDSVALLRGQARNSVLPHLTNEALGELTAGAVNVLRRIESRGWVGMWF